MGMTVKARAFWKLWSFPGCDWVSRSKKSQLMGSKGTQDIWRKPHERTQREEAKQFFLVTCKEQNKTWKTVKILGEIRKILSSNGKKRMQRHRLKCPVRASLCGSNGKASRVHLTLGPDNGKVSRVHLTLDPECHVLEEPPKASKQLVTGFGALPRDHCLVTTPRLG